MFPRLQPRRALALLALAALLLGATPATPAAAEGACVPQWMDGVGLACRRSEGLLEVFSPSGESLGYTHGADPVPAPGEPVMAASDPRPPMCMPGVAGEYSIQVIYARAHDGADRYSWRADTARSLTERANAILNDAAARTGDGADLRVRCVDGIIDVRNEVLPTDKANAEFNTIVSDLKARGYNDARVKYWVFYDDTSACSCGGTGHIYGDSSLSSSNLNNGNAGPMFAVTFGYDSPRIWLHELGHNLGAVQNSAPHATGGYHCTDGRDTMCYNDGAAKGGEYTTGRCSTEVFDCGGDDYFNAQPAAGTYLASKWNLGSRLIRYIAFGTPALDMLNCPRLAPLDRPATCQVRAQDDSPGVFYTVDWGNGVTERVPETGYLRPGVITDISHQYTETGEVFVSVFATDDESPARSSHARSASITLRHDIDPPTVTFLEPRRGVVYEGCEIIGATPYSSAVFHKRGCVHIDATDNYEVAEVVVTLSGVELARMTEAPYQFEFETTGFHPQAILLARAVDVHGNEQTRGVSVVTL